MRTVDAGWARRTPIPLDDIPQPSTITPMTESLLTQSAAATFRNCRKMAYLRFEEGLVPKEEAEEFRFGSLWHDGLQVWHWTYDLKQTLGIINGKGKSEGMEWHEVELCKAMMKGYVRTYSAEKDQAEWEVVELEKEWKLNMPTVLAILGDEASEQYNALADQVNALTEQLAAVSPHFVRAGKVDGVLRNRESKKLWLVEHKSTGKIDGGYLQRLWLDFQITYYVAAMQEIHGESFEGVLYNIAEKPSKKERTPVVGETDIEFQARYDAAKNKKLLKRRMSETPDQFIARVTEEYQEDGRFVRQNLMLTPEDIATVLQEAVDIASDWMSARGHGRWYRNTSFCFKWNKPCGYFNICQSRDNPFVIEAGYEKRDIHNELALAAQPV
jgi:hypothetical protein